VIPELLQRHSTLSFVFIGRDDGLPGEQKMFDYLRDHTHPFEEKLYYWPPLPKEQLYPIISESLGVLMPSRVDNYPNACLEAYSLGIPVVGTDNSSLEEMIIDGKTGFLAVNGDADSFCEAVERLLAQTAVERQMMHQNILNNTQSITAKDRVGQLIEFYKEATASLRAID
jgi:glycosyltransferase involved in cell wall biosynthesis